MQEEFIKSLNLPNGEIVGDDYLIILKDSDEYAKVYTLLSKNEELTLDEDTITMDLFGTHLEYYTDEYRIELNADFEKDTYTVKVKEEK